MFKHKCQCSRQRGEETARGNAVAHKPPTQEQMSCITQYISFRQQEQSSSLQKHSWTCEPVCGDTRTFSRHVFDVTPPCVLTSTASLGFILIFKPPLLPFLQGRYADDTSAKENSFYSAILRKSPARSLTASKGNPAGVFGGFSAPV